MYIHIYIFKKNEFVIIIMYLLILIKKLVSLAKSVKAELK